MQKAKKISHRIFVLLLLLAFVATGVTRAFACAAPAQDGSKKAQTQTILMADHPEALVSALQFDLSQDFYIIDCIGPFEVKTDDTSAKPQTFHFIHSYFRNLFSTAIAINAP